MGYPFNTRSAPHTRLTKVEQFRLLQDAKRAFKNGIAQAVANGIIAGGGGGHFVLNDDDGNALLDDVGNKIPVG